MGANAAVPNWEPLSIDCEVVIDGASKLERFRQLRAGLLGALRSNGLLERTGSYSGLGTGRDGKKIYCAITVLSTGRSYRAEVPLHGRDSTRMEIYVA